MYESKLTDRRWLTLGLLSDLGWIAFFVGIAVYMLSGADGLGTVAISALFLMTFAAAVAVLIGIIALISQRLRGIGRTVSRRQRILGYGLSVYGALAGGMCALASVITDLVFGYEGGVCLIAQGVMCAGALVCFGFGLPILRSFRPAEAL